MWCWLYILYHSFFEEHLVRCSIMRLEHCMIELGPLLAVFVALFFALCFTKAVAASLFAYLLTRWCLTWKANVLFVSFSSKLLVLRPKSILLMSVVLINKSWPCIKQKINRKLKYCWYFFIIIISLSELANSLHW